MQIKDHSISQEEFRLVYHKELDCFETNPIPSNLNKYYISNNYITYIESIILFVE